MLLKSLSKMASLRNSILSTGLEYVESNPEDDSNLVEQRLSQNGRDDERDSVDDQVGAIASPPRIHSETGEVNLRPSWSTEDLPVNIHSEVLLEQPCAKKCRTFGHPGPFTKNATDEMHETKATSCTHDLMVQNVP